MIIRKFKELMKSKNDLFTILEKIIEQKDKTIKAMQMRIDYLERNQK